MLKIQMYKKLMFDKSTFVDSLIDFASSSSLSYFQATLSTIYLFLSNPLSLSFLLSIKAGSICSERVRWLNERIVLSKSIQLEA